MKARSILLFAALFAVGLVVGGNEDAASSEERLEEILTEPRIERLRDPALRAMSVYLKETTALLAAKAYEALEHRALEALEKKERFANGTWKLQAFYAAFSPPADAPAEVWEARIADLKAWRAIRLSSATPHIALAEIYVRYAWKGRDSAVMEVASGELTHPSDTRLEEALRILEDARMLGIRDPQYWRTAHAVAVGLRWPAASLDEIHAQGAALEPEYWSLDVARAFVLLAQGTSGLEALNTFAAGSASAPGGSGDEIYARIAWEVRDVYRNLFDQTQLDWSRVEAGYRALLRRYPGSPELLSQYCLLACRARDRATARRCFVKLGGRLDLRAFDSARDYQRHYRWANATP